MKHWILMGGEHGCMPDYCCACRTLLEACADAEGLYELSRSQWRELLRTQYLELGPKYGASYCEIVKCDCDEPWTHNEDDSAEDWQ